MFGVMPANDREKVPEGVGVARPRVDGQGADAQSHRVERVLPSVHGGQDDRAALQRRIRILEVITSRAVFKGGKHQIPGQPAQRQPQSQHVKEWQVHRGKEGGLARVLPAACLGRTPPEADRNCTRRIRA